MPHFTLSLIQHGAILIAFVGVSTARSSALKEAGLPIPKFEKITAMVDTGASSTCVDPSVLHALNLTPTGSVLVKTPSTGLQPVPAEQYDVSLFVPSSDASHIPLSIVTLPVICCKDFLQSQGFHALIGRDVLSHCILIYNGGENTFTIAY